MKTLLLLLLCGSALAQQDTTRWLEITAYESPNWPLFDHKNPESVFRIYVQNDTLKFYTNTAVDSAAQLVLRHMVKEYSDRIAQYDSLCEAYNRLRLYTAFFMWQVGRQDDNKITFDLAKKHLDYPACKLP